MTLKHLIDGRPMELDDLLDIAIEIADALDAAHAPRHHSSRHQARQYLRHRRGHAKILDFGLAKSIRYSGAGPRDRGHARHQPPRSDSGEMFTSPGTAVGTVAYMSPEQVRGKELDARSDLFSFGTVLYEMSTGVMPFRGDTTGVIFDAILNRVPPPAIAYQSGHSAEARRNFAEAARKRSRDALSSGRRNSRRPETPAPRIRFIRTRLCRAAFRKCPASAPHRFRGSDARQLPPAASTPPCKRHQASAVREVAGKHKIGSALTLCCSARAGSRGSLRHLFLSLAQKIVWLRTLHGYALSPKPAKPRSPRISPDGNYILQRATRWRPAKPVAPQRSNEKQHANRSAFGRSYTAPEFFTRRQFYLFHQG